MFELKYDWSRRFQFEFEWIELTIVDNKLARNGQLAGAGKERSAGEYGTRDTARGILDALDTRIRDTGHGERNTGCPRY